jgi:Tellurite resistance protein TerB
MNIDTTAIRRLRDQLFSSAGDNPAEAPPSPQIAAAIRRRVEPFAETMFLVMRADGDSARVEEDALAAAIDVLSDGQLSRADIAAMFGHFAATLLEQGAEGRIAHLGAHVGGDRDDRETAFMLGAVVALADDRVDVREHRVLEWIRTYFGISDRRTAALLDSL